MHIYSPISVDVVVEGELLVLLDKPVGENAHPDVLADGPLRNITVRVTTVVCETTDSTAFGSVNVLPKRDQEGRRRC